jgi:hypothetical protein
MKAIIKENIDNPEKLEQLYRDDRKSFESGFEKIYPEIEKTELAKYWKIRLDFDKVPRKTGKANLTDIFVLISACLIAGFLIKIPDLFNLKQATFLFYEKNAAIIVFLGLTIYVAWINKNLEQKRLAMILIAFIIPAIYINLLPSAKVSASVNLAYVHLPLLMWLVFGLVYIDFDLKDRTRRIEYIKYNGDLAILAAIIMIAGAILTGITIGLFQAIGINIEKFYMENVVIIGLVSVPVIATYIIKNYTALTNKIAPIIASIFSPLVLLTAIIFLIALAVSGKDPYKDREFLLIFNIMLFGVMAIIVFSVSETSLARKQKFNEMVLFVLSVITAIIDLIALSAISYRLGSFGISPNRLAVLGSNILILGNLVLIIIDLYKINFKNSLIEKVELTISKYIPVYAIWLLFVVFGFPLIFQMK